MARFGRHRPAVDETRGVRAVVQRVRRAEVTVDGVVVGAVGTGLCCLVGVFATDGETNARRLAEKLWHLRVFPDEAGTMNRAAADVGAGMLVVSQFTLCADMSRGRRPSWAPAAPPEHAEPLVDLVAATLAELGATVATGRFGAHMVVGLENDGPVTLVVDV